MRWEPAPTSPASDAFLEVDPVEGGSANDYDYVEGDPINQFDLTGTFWVVHNSSGGCKGGGLVRKAEKAWGCDLRCSFATYGTMAMGAVVTVGVCAATAVVGCVIAGAVVGAAVAVVHHVTKTNSRKEWRASRSPGQPAAR